MLPFTSHWPKRSRMTTPSWEMESFSRVARRQEILGLACKDSMKNASISPQYWGASM